MSTNLYPKADGRNLIWNEGFKLVNQEETTFASTNQTMRAIREELGSTVEENSSTLGLIFHHLRQYNDELQTATNFMSIKKVLVNLLKEKQKARDEALRMKQEKKMVKAEVNAKLELLKTEMDNLNRENHAIQEKLNDTSRLPLICRLMKSERE
jgi:regulator of replication initiation timing